MADPRRRRAGPPALVERGGELRLAPRIALLLLVALATSIASDAAAQSLKKQRTRAAGLSAGAPQIIAFTYEEALTPHWRLQGNVGTLILVSSLNARMLWFPQTESIVHLYLHAGVGFFHAVAMDYGNPDGGSPYVWFGSGFRVKASSLRLFFELSRITGMSTENNYDRDLTSGAVGMLWEW